MRRRIALCYPKATFGEVAHAIVDVAYVPINGIAASIIAVKSGGKIDIKLTNPRFYPVAKVADSVRNQALTMADVIKQSAEDLDYPLSSLNIENCFKANLLIVTVGNQLAVRIQEPVIVSAKKETPMDGIASVAGNVVASTTQFAAQQLNRSHGFKDRPIQSERSNALSGGPTIDHQHTIHPLVRQARKTPERVIDRVNGVEIAYRNIPENTLFIAKTRQKATEFINMIHQNHHSGVYQKILSRGLVIIPPVEQNKVYLVQVASKSDRARRAEAEAELAQIKSRYSRAFEYLDRHPGEIEKIETYVNRFISNSQIASIGNIGISALNVVGSVATGFGVTAIPTIVASVFAEVNEQQLRADCRSILRILEQMKKEVPRSIPSSTK